MFALSAFDRVLVLAPHPDDESLATGGLLQRALAAGAEVRVVFVTDGDNNPWPQRVLERRWRIDAADRARWAARRREEAREAIAVLGGEESAVAFLGFPDQGLTHLLESGDPALPAQLAAEIADFQPTLLVLPSAQDRHPDHNALHVLARHALDRTGGNGTRVFEYLVHDHGLAAPSQTGALRLTTDEIATKRAAILCHKTQVALCRRRFLAYAGPRELYSALQPAEAECASHPVRSAMLANGALQLGVQLAPWRFGSGRLVISLHGIAGESGCWSLPLPRASARVGLCDESTGEVFQQATVRMAGSRAEVRVPLTFAPPLARLFVKLATPRLFFDAAGWREIPTLPEPSFANGSASPLLARVTRQSAALVAS